MPKNKTAIWSLNYRKFDEVIGLWTLASNWMNFFCSRKFQNICGFYTEVCFLNMSFGQDSGKWYKCMPTANMLLFRKASLYSLKNIKNIAWECSKIFLGFILKYVFWMFLAKIAENDIIACRSWTGCYPK